MTRTENPSPLQDLQLMLAHLIQQFGLKQIIIVLIKEALKPAPRRPDATQVLSDHLRQDVGLPPKFPTTQHWWHKPF
ncbi:hypothetical protein WG622_18830 [Cognatishimia sp. D5M38]|uniref:Uncharacterized protein n=1 Tax=Cognatishimia coralii TaxID=3083254 RepID=A0ABU8QLL7_9RHOB